MSWVKKADYQGWTNYETWAVALWIDNEQGSYNESRDRARDLLRDHYDDVSRAEISLADWLKEFITEGEPDLGATLYSDLLTSAIGSVNWDEIAESYIEEVKDEIDKEKREEAEAEKRLTEPEAEIEASPEAGA